MIHSSGLAYFRLAKNLEESHAEEWPDTSIYIFVGMAEPRELHA
jgi:hypothetical protein